MTKLYSIFNKRNNDKDNNDHTFTATLNDLLVLSHQASSNKSLLFKEFDKTTTVIKLFKNQASFKWEF